MEKLLVSVKGKDGEEKLKVERKELEKKFVDGWNKGMSKSGLILMLRKEGDLYIDEILMIFKKYGIKMIYNFIYNVELKNNCVKVRKGEGDREKIEFIG